MKQRLDAFHPPCQQFLFLFSAFLVSGNSGTSLFKHLQEQDKWQRNMR
jgi:hypothetical protein